MKDYPLSPLIDLARTIAREAHDGQTRRDGKTPYFIHPLMVAVKLQAAGESDEVIAAGFLHDVIEDSDLSHADLLSRGLPDSVVDAARVLTKREGDTYLYYLSLVRANPIARKVKIADMLSNLSDNPTPKQIRKYAEGLLFLVDPE